MRQNEATPSYHYYVQQQRRLAQNDGGWSNQEYYDLQRTSSVPSDTTTTYVEQNSDASSEVSSPEYLNMALAPIHQTTKKNSPRGVFDLANWRPKNKYLLQSSNSKSRARLHGAPDQEANPELHNQKRLFSFLFSKKVPPVPLPEERKPYPWKKTNLINRGVFYWLLPILVKGYKRTLVPDDLWELTDELTVENMHERYRKNLESILRKSTASHLRKNPSLDNWDWPAYAIPWALFLSFRLQYCMSCFFLALSFVCQAMSPLVTRKLIDFVEDQFFGIETTYNKGIGYTICAVVLIFINGLLLNHFFHNAMVTGAAARSILTKDVLMKSFKLSAKAKHRFPLGRIHSLMSTDLLRIDLAIGFQPLVLCFPIPVIIAVVLLLTNIGVASLVGIGLFIVSLIICVLLTSKLVITREIVVKHTDERISLMRELLNNLKIIKFYAWEMAYKTNITNVRAREMRYLFSIKVLRNFITAYAVTLPTMSSMISFVTMWKTSSMRNVGRVFSSLSLFSILAQAIMLLPIALATGADAWIGFRRCRDFFSSDEINDDLDKALDPSAQHYFIGPGHGEDDESVLGFEFAVGGDSDSANSENSVHQEKHLHYGKSVELPVAIEVSHADFMWEVFTEDEDEEKQSLWQDSKSDAKDPLVTDPLGKSGPSGSAMTCLTDVSLTVNNGEFVVITGSIGSGKTSLLNALAGFMKMTNAYNGGKLSVNNDLLLCGTPWIQNATVRENILFGQPMDRARYYAVLRACCLEEDLKELSHGDNTEIGERGITLSGGQKARINLARAVYRDASTLLFDDVLSAVDSRVGKKIINGLFFGLLRNKTRILATHQLSLVLRADKIVFLPGDGSVDVGTMSQLAQRSDAFKKLVDFSHEEKQEECQESPPPIDTAESDHVCLLPGADADDELRYAAHLSVLPESGASGDVIGRTVADEELQVNSISWDVYRKYIKLGSGVFGVFAAPIFLVLVSLATFCQVFTNTWLSFWMENKFKQLSDRFYVAFYVLFAFLTVFFTGIEFTMLAYMNNRSAELLNVRSVEKVLHAPMLFMDTNPLGRVLNRFTKDTDSLDNEIGEQLRLFIFPLATIIGIVILCICYLPWFAIAVPFLGGTFIFLLDFYSGSSREIKRLESLQRSVVYNNFNEMLTGMATIKAFKEESNFMAKNDYLLNRMNEAYFLSIANQRWLCLHLDIMAAIFALIICMLCITEQFNISASSTGLLLNYVIQIVGLLSLTVRAMTQCENEMNSVERLHQYAFHMPQEAAYHKNETQPPPEWPMTGYIQFNDVTMKYRENLPPVLKDLNFGVYPGEKVGICGRTGAGKSSIMMTLYRLNELNKGNITIDGLDISTLGLHELRSKLLIIPQDPVLFQGSIRSNLDPFSEYPDDLLWDSLRRSGLIDAEKLPYVKTTHLENGDYTALHKFHLDQKVQDDGENFSLGEKQLIALARSLVRNSKILILDEATSSVDYETDAKIQNTIIREFDRCTILCIAHRLKTILNYDRILVMDQGRVVEKGTPWTLYRKNGLFKQMCDKASISAADFQKPNL